MWFTIQCAVERHGGPRAVQISEYTWLGVQVIR